MLTIDKKALLPVYQQIKTELREQIVSGGLKAGAVIPNERSLAVQLSVSRMTVRRAIVDLTREGLLHRIRGKGTFVRNSCRPPRRVRRISIGVLRGVDPGPSSEPSLDLFYYRLLHGVSLGCAEAEMHVSYYEATAPFDAFVAGLNREKTLKGLIVIGIALQSLLRELKQLTVPVVLLDSVQPDDGACYDEVNHHAEPAVYEAVLHLLRLGHRRIGLLHACDVNAINIQRMNGFTRALQKFGLVPDPALLFPVPICSDAGYATVQRMLNEPNPPTAVVCYGDQVAVGAMSAVTDHGWKVPRDLSLVGFGDEGYFTSPRLSTVRIPLEQMGARAVEMMAERMKRPAAPLKQLQVSTEWIVRGTCDRPRQ